MDQKALIFASNIVHFGVILEHIRELFLQYVLFLFDMIKYLWTKSQSNPATKVLYGFTDWGWNLSTNDEYYLPNCHFTGRFLYFLVKMLNGFSKGIESSPNKWKLPNKIHLEGPFLYFLVQRLYDFNKIAYNLIQPEEIYLKSFPLRGKILVEGLQSHTY